MAQFWPNNHSSRLAAIFFGFLGDRSRGKDGPPSTTWSLSKCYWRWIDCISHDIIGSRSFLHMRWHKGCFPKASTKMENVPLKHKKRRKMLVFPIEVNKLILLYDSLCLTGWLSAPKTAGHFWPRLTCKENRHFHWAKGHSLWPSPPPRG